MKTTCLKTLIIVLSITLSAVATAQNKIPMPPRFDISSEPKEILSTYPLGIISKEAAFAHHGPALQKFRLPNNNEGWLYKAGEEAGIPSNYVLQFSNAGVVIDVLHKDYRYKMGHSALQYQYLLDAEVKHRSLGSRPGE